MLRFAIVEDEAVQARLLETLLTRWARRQEDAIQVSHYASAEAFLFEWEEPAAYTALLLDIQMPGMDGMSLARKLRSHGEQAPILFITGDAGHMAEGYDVSALHYLLKPVDEAKLFACLDRVASQQAAPETFLLVDTPDGPCRIAQKDLLWAEALGHKVSLHMLQGEIHTTTPLTAIEAALSPEAFIRCHRAYIAGLRHIARLDKSSLHMDNGACLPISRRLHAQVMQAFIAYHKEAAHV